MFNKLMLSLIVSFDNKWMFLAMVYFGELSVIPDCLNYIRLISIKISKLKSTLNEFTDAVSFSSGNHFVRSDGVSSLLHF